MTRHVFRIVAATLIACAVCTSAYGQTRAAAENHDARAVVEPIVTEETLPNEPGEWVLRWSGRLDHLEKGTNAQLPRGQLFFGMTDRLGGEVDAPVIYSGGDGRHYGIGDVATSVKWLAAGNRSTAAVTIGGEIAWPTGSEPHGAGEGTIEMHPFVGALTRMGRVDIQGNVGWSRQLRDGGDSGLAYDWAMAVPTPSARLAALAEISGRWMRGEEPSTVAVAPGFRYRFAHGTSLGFAVPIDVRAMTKRWSVVTQWQTTLWAGGPQ